MAGKFYLLHGDYKAAMKMLLLANDDDVALQLAIKCAMNSKDLQLVKILTNYLLSEADGVPKDMIDSNFIFRLYISLQMYIQKQQKLQ